MSMSKNIARLAVTAGLTAALSFGGVMAPVTMAFAEGATTTTNSITINKYNNNGNENGNVQYKAYRIFKALDYQLHPNTSHIHPHMYG